MTINIWDPMASMARLSHDMDIMLRRAMRSHTDLPEGVYMPAADVLRDGDDALITLEIPGMNEDDINIDVEPGRLTVSGQREERVNDAEDHLRELRYGEFRREFSLPQGIPADAVSASYDKGMLEIRISGAARTESTAKKIPVQRATQIEK